MLAVVRRRLRVALALRQRLHGAAERRARLEQRHLGARVDEVERRREAGEAAPDDRRPYRHPLGAPAECAALRGAKSPLATTASFAGVESRVFSPNTS